MDALLQGFGFGLGAGAVLAVVAMVFGWEFHFGPKESDD